MKHSLDPRFGSTSSGLHLFLYFNIIILLVVTVLLRVILGYRTNFITDTGRDSCIREAWHLSLGLVSLRLVVWVRKGKGAGPGSGSGTSDIYLQVHLYEPGIDVFVVFGIELNVLELAQWDNTVEAPKCGHFGTERKR